MRSARKYFSRLIEMIYYATKHCLKILAVIRLTIKLCRVFDKQGKVTLQCKMPITDNRIWEDLEFPTLGYI